MNFKKPFKVLTTAALIASLSISGTTTVAFAKENEKSVSQKATIAHSLDKIILENNKRKIAVSFDDYIAVAGNDAALNSYEIKYLTDVEGNNYSLEDYVGYFSEGMTPEQVIEKLSNEHKKEVANVEVGEIKDGRLSTTEPNTLTTPEKIIETESSTTLSSEGTYGGTEDHPQVIEGDLIIANDRVNISNVVVKGKLTISNSVKSGEVIVDNTKVEGNTYVKGGGLNSVFFQDSVIATIIVNKNDGKVRVVTTGSTSVEEVRLESYAKLEEVSLSNGAEGFTDVRVDPTVQAASGGLEAIELIGEYETINSKAYRVKINLPENTLVQKITLDAIAYVTGQGLINEAEINTNASGAIFDQSLQNVVLNDAYIEANGQQISESTSEATSAELQTAKLSPDSAALTFSTYVANINSQDFDVEATIDGEIVELEDINYSPAMKRLFFEPVVNTSTIGKKLKLKVTPKGKLTGQPITTEEITLQEGFSGRITNVQGTGVSNATLTFTSYDDEDFNAITETDAYGYYYVNAPGGEYKGKITGNNIVETNLYPYTSSNRFTSNQNETAIYTAATTELRIMLKWGEYPYDVDSHLVGLNSEGQPFHVYYGDKIAMDTNGLNIVDLDYDDTDSYGPETTTFRKLKDGQYIFYLHNFDGNSINYIYNEETDEYEDNGYKNTLDQSQATIQVLQGESDVPIEEIQFDAGEGKPELYYYAFGIEISNNGENVKVVPIKKFDHYVESDQLANLKTYLPNLIENAENSLNYSDDLAEDKKIELQELVNNVKSINIETANFETLIEATLNLKVLLSEDSYDYDY